MPVGVMARVATCMRGPGTSPLAMACLDVHVGIHCAFGFKIANRGEAILESDTRVARGENGTIRNRLFEKLLVIIFGSDVAVEKNVRVQIDKAGENGGIRKVNQFDAGWRSGSCGNGDNFVVLDQDEGVVEHLFRFAVDEMAGTNGDAFGWSCFRVLSGKVVSGATSKMTAAKIQVRII